MKDIDAKDATRGGDARKARDARVDVRRSNTHVCACAPFQKAGRRLVWGFRSHFLFCVVRHTCCHNQRDGRLTRFFSNNTNFTGRRSPNPRGDSHGPSTRVRDGRWTYRTTVRCHEILRRRRRAGEYLGVAAIRHRVFAHFIWSFYHFELRAV